MKYVLLLEYDGSQFRGWQQQNNLRTVQNCLEEALSKVANENITTVCAGRTDAGVHAKEQVVHFETSAIRPEKAWVLGTNTFLPPDIKVYSAKPIAQDFHARFSALARQYHYRIINQRVKPAIYRNYLTWDFRELKVELMNEAAKYFLGEQDFSSFRSADCQSKSPFRCVEHLQILQQSNIITLDIQANAFLHHMVRNIAGVLMAIGAGEKSPRWALEVLQARDRSAATVTAPPNGLYLMHVVYPERFCL